MNGLPPALTETMNGYAAYGYPSGHIMQTVLVAGTALRRLPAPGAALVAAMMALLVDLGDHWTSDALGGSAPRLGVRGSLPRGLATVGSDPAAAPTVTDSPRRPSGPPRTCPKFDELGNN